jgi:hypothetical protein
MTETVLIFPEQVALKRVELSLDEPERVDSPTGTLKKNYGNRK